MTVRELMQTNQRPLLTIEPEATVQGAIQIMSSERVSALPVMEGEALMGIISERDYVRKIAARRIPAWSVKVREVMTEEVITVSPEDDLSTCMELMVSNRIRHLPVVVEGVPVAMLSITDVLGAIKP